MKLLKPISIKRLHAKSLLLIGAFGVVTLVAAVYAAPPANIKVEAETGGTLNNASVGSDSAASGQSYLVFNNPQPPSSNSFLETFDGAPATPQPWNPINWDWTVTSRDFHGETFDAMQAEHGPNCEPPTVTHHVDRFDQAIFGCRDHLMTSIKGEGYALIYITPNHMVDFSQGEAVIKIDVSTFRSSQRDWWDVWVTPYEDHVQLAGEDWYPDLQGNPRRGVHIRQAVFNTTKTGFLGRIINNFGSSDFCDECWTGYEDFLTADKARRDTFELRISRTHLKFCMPADNETAITADTIPSEEHCWINRTIPDLGFTQGVVQFGHHSYNPDKDDVIPGAHAGTWHWDNASISPSKKFTIMKGDKRMVNNSSTSISFLGGAAPANARLRFAGIGSNIQFSTDGGSSWTNATKQATSRPGSSDHYDSYFTPIPQGTTNVQIRGGDSCCGPWSARDISIWALP